MSTVLLFCTAPVPANVINQLLGQCVLSDPDLAFNMFSLVRTAEQDTLDRETQPPVQDFDTGFKGSSDTSLWKFAEDFKTRMEEGGCIDKRWIAILDEKSVTQSAIIMQYRMRKEDWDARADEGEFPLPGNAELTDDGMVRFKWRVPFRYAWSIWNAVVMVPGAIELYSRPSFLGSDGVLRADIPDKILKGEMEDPSGEV